MENHARYGEMIYSHKGDEELIVNLFIPSTLKWGKTMVEQVNNFPAEESTSLVINPEKPRKFTVSIRVPEWVNGMSVAVNGVNVNAAPSDGLIRISRKWSKGDRISVALPMSLRAVSLPDRSDNYSFMYGPVVLAASLGKEEQLGMYADDSRGGHIAAGKQLPLQDMPVIVGDRTNLLANITKVEGKPLTFNLTGTAPDKYAKGMTLVPFSSLHECRYMVYWPVLSENQWQERLARQEMEEKARIALESVTADKVICGEQQPESDHFFRMENSMNGDHNGRHWRAARTEGWFSYVMNTRGNEVKNLRIVCTGRGGSEAVIMMNGTEAGRFRTVSPNTEETHLISVPADMTKADTITVTISCSGERSTPMIYEVRLVTE
jgi:hypothetical protein